MILPLATREKRAPSFGEIQFGDAKLGDARRTKRLVTSANILARHPGGTLPEKFKSPKDLKAFYRLCNCEDVTHKAILAAHRKVTFDRIVKQRPVLVLHDSTELDYTGHNSVKGLGQIGNGKRKGYITHNSLAVDPNNKEAIGLCSQILHHRVKVRQNETDAQRRKRKSRESRLWVQGTKALPNDWNLVDVCDQGADTFEFLYHEYKSGRRFVVRSVHNRGMLIGHERACHNASADAETCYLRDYARTLPELGTWTLQVTSKKELKSPKGKGKKRKVTRVAREATMVVSSARIQVKPPNTKSGDYEEKPIPMWIVRIWEMSPPKGQERLEWFLLTNEPVDSFEEAYEVVEWYECRWVIEEYHKCLKTGCQIESPQFQRQQSLQPAIAIISVTALTLLNLRDASRKPDAKTRPAKELISEDYIAVLSAWRHGEIKNDWSVYDFCYALARLGGHQNRKSDNHPGWIVLWRGWQELQAMMRGADVINELNKCGHT